MFGLHPKLARTNQVWARSQPNLDHFGSQACALRRPATLGLCLLNDAAILNSTGNKGGPGNASRRPSRGRGGIRPGPMSSRFAASSSSASSLRILRCPVEQNCSPGRTFISTNLSRVRPQIANVGQVWNWFDLVRADLGQRWPNSTQIRQISATFKVGISSTEFGPSWANFGSSSSKSNRCQSTLVDFDSSRADYGQRWPTSAKLGDRKGREQYPRAKSIDIALTSRGSGVWADGEVEKR